MKRIDACGMSCPQPVLMTKKAIDGNVANIEVIVDNNTAQNNVQRFLKSRDYKVTIKAEGELTVLIAEK
ncbi:hypothetical protein SH2C18_27070 [Clostridium sediminicola]|uniref:sulfurtransferase TusA family protein n=1 Tax=Clostridium sediminicola TaxID=3114879 RepID=UPI0031F243D6